jgi:hypothetical protein
VAPEIPHCPKFVKVGWKEARNELDYKFEMLQLQEFEYILY